MDHGPSSLSAPFEDGHVPYGADRLNVGSYAVQAGPRLDVELDWSVCWQTDVAGVFIA